MVEPARKLSLSICGGVVSGSDKRNRGCDTNYVMGLNEFFSTDCFLSFFRCEI